MKAFERDGKMVKTCSRCKETKDVSEYGMDRGRSDGLNKTCRACLKRPPKPKRKTQYEIDIENGFKVCKECHESQDLLAYSCTSEIKRYNLCCKRCHNDKIRAKKRAMGVRPPPISKYRAHEAEGKMVKRCKRCKEIKDVSQFGSNEGTDDGYQTRCHVCVKKTTAHKPYERDGVVVKRCTKCHEEKEATAFYMSRGTITSRCRACHGRDHIEKHREKNPKPWGGRYTREELKTKSRREIDKERGWKECQGCGDQAPLDEFEFDKRWQVYGTKCLECQRKKTLAYRKANRESVRANGRRYIKEQRKDPHSAAIIKRCKKRYYEKHTLSCRIRGGMGQSLKGKKGGRKWQSLVNYTLQDLKAHMESLFVEGMSWEAFKRGEIEIDHVLPKELFRFETAEDPQFAACWALTNLQPLWGRDNAIKGDLLDDGRRARELTQDEKRIYLISKGYGHLFESTIPIQPSDQASHSPSESVPSDPTVGPASTG